MTTPNQTLDAAIKNYAPLETIVSEGSTPGFFYVILEGSVEISQNLKTIRTLRDDDVFGLENYYRKRPYTTTATALTSARIAAYHSETIREILYSHPQLAEKIFTSVMGQLEQTTGIAEENITVELAAPIREHEYKDGEIIISENITNTALFRLIQSKHGLRVTAGGNEIETITKAGELFGPLSPLVQQPCDVTVSSIGRSRIQIIPNENLAESLKQAPDLAITIINALSGGLRETNRLLANSTKARSV